MMMRPARTKRRGASAVEMAFVAPVFLTLVLGIIESSRLGMVVPVVDDRGTRGLPGRGDQRHDPDRCPEPDQRRAQRLGDLGGDRDPDLPGPYTWTHRARAGPRSR